MGREVYIVEAVRTPIGRGKEDGALHGIHPVDLLARTLDTLVRRAGVEKSQVEDIVAGCVTPIGEQGTNVGRLAGLKAGFPIEVPGVQVNRFCGSGQQAIHFAAQAIAAGDTDLAVGCGIESMSRVPMGSDAGLTEEFRASFPYELLHQGISAEMVAAKWNIGRAELDDFAIRSHALAAEAQHQTWTCAEIFPVELNGGPRRLLDFDEGVRSSVDPAKIGSLKPVFKADGVITAANSSQISDGAAA